MSTEPVGRVFRVTVRGRFDDLSDRARRQLEAHVDEHSIFNSAYTAEGTFTYDEKLQFFNLRYECRAEGPDAEAEAGLTGLTEAELFLRTLGYGFRDLKVNVVDMSAMWDGTRPE